MCACLRRRGLLAVDPAQRWAYDDCVLSKVLDAGSLRAMAAEATAKAEEQRQAAAQAGALGESTWEMADQAQAWDAAAADFAMLLVRAEVKEGPPPH
jgi:hypothetical protein